MFKLMLVYLTIMVMMATFSLSALGLDLNTDNVFNAFLPVLIEVKGSLGVTLQLRCIAMASEARFEASAIYSKKWKGKYLNGIVRRPESEHTQYNKNVAHAYAMYNVFLDLTPEYTENLASIMTGLGLDPNNKSRDLKTAAGIGNYVADVLLAHRHRDGMNQLGDEEGYEFNRMNYSDYTKFKPTNDHFYIKDPDAWQPAMAVDAKKRPIAQAYLTPQIAHLDAFFINPNQGHIPDQDDRLDQHPEKYKEKADHVIDVQVNLSDRQKLIAEFFDNKALGLRLLGDHIAHLYGNGSLDFHTVLNFIVNSAAHEVMAPMWRFKTKYNSARPFTTIHHLYSGKKIQGWGGPGKGIVEMDGSEWRSYLSTDAFPDYPSGTSCVCAAWVEGAKTFINANYLGFTYLIPKGKSVIEPGYTPQEDLTLSFDTLDQVAEDCMLSRVYGGVHHLQAVTEARKFCTPLGKAVADKVKKMIQGL